MAAQATRRRRRSSNVADLIALDRHTALPLSDQLFLAIRACIEEGKLAPGDRLPSTRDLAKQLDVGRNTALSAYVELLMHGFVETRTGHGTIVSSSAGRRDGVTEIHEAPAAAAPRKAVARGHHWCLHPRLERFCARMQIAAARDAARMDPQEISETTAALLAQSLMMRGVRCSSDQVAIAADRRQALVLVAEALSSVAGAVWFEDPGDPVAAAALEAGGLPLLRLPVDQFGANIRSAAAGGGGAPAAGGGGAPLGAVYVTPPHHLPLGVTLDDSRRAALLEWARSSNGWIIEDESTAFLRWPMPPPLFGTTERVIHVSTVALPLDPFLGLTAVIATQPVVETIRRRAQITGASGPLIEQRAGARALSARVFRREQRRLRLRAHDRDLAILRHATAQLLWFASRVTGTETGERAVLWLQVGFPADELAQALRARDFDVSTLRDFARGDVPDALVLGLTHIADHEIEPHLAKVAESVRSFMRGFDEEPRLCHLA